MFIGETLRASVAALQANKFRTFLTALGLVIGNASVILVVTISLTSRDYIIAQIERIGSNMIYANFEGGSNASGASADADHVKIADVEAIREQLGPRIVAATAVMNSYDRMRIEGREEDVAIIGSDEYYAPVRNLALLSGRLLDASDIRYRNHVALLTERLARRLYGGQQQAIGRKVKLQGLQFDIVGTFKEKTDTLGQSELSGENILIPISVLKYFSRVERIDPVYVQARTPADVEPVTQTVRTILESRHRRGARYRVDNLKSILETARSIATVLTIVLILVSLLALVISGIGIMNIMLVTVTERTREIGLRMSLGATRGNVLAQFLSEAVLIGLVGGSMGILLGVAVPLSVKFLTDDFAIPISVLSIAIAFAASLIVGLVSGYIPASRAARLNPTEALRYE